MWNRHAIQVVIMAERFLALPLNTSPRDGVSLRYPQLFTLLLAQG